MEYTKFNDEISLSRLGFGAMRLPQDGEGWGAPIDEKRATALIDYCMENGVNYYDSAFIYNGGESEKFLGRALSKYPREKYYLSDKYRLLFHLDYRQQFEEQLKRLQTDYIDFYMIHGIQDEWVEEALTNGCIEYFNGLREDGKIRNLGLSIHCNEASLRKLIDANKWDFILMQINYYDWEYGNEKNLYAIAGQANIPVFVMEPLCGGLLATLTEEAAAPLKKAAPGRSLASWGMRWLMDLQQVKVVISGMSAMEQVVDNIATFSEYKPLSESEKEILAVARDLYRPAISVACTNCRYCVADCPAQLDIPRLIQIYNDAKIGGFWRASFQESLPEGKRAADCTGCGVCSSKCPQGFNIPAYIKELAETNYKMPPPPPED